MVRAFEKINFFIIDYMRLPYEVREAMPQKADTVCMKYLLPNWQKNRYDLIRVPTLYDRSPNGDIMR